MGCIWPVGCGLPDPCPLLNLVLEGEHAIKHFGSIDRIRTWTVSWENIIFFWSQKCNVITVKLFLFSEIHSEVFRRKEICMLHTFKWLRKKYMPEEHMKKTVGQNINSRWIWVEYMGVFWYCSSFYKLKLLPNEKLNEYMCLCM